MKKIFALSFLLLLIHACSGEKTETLDVYSTEAYAYDIGDGTWEVTTTTQVKGFNQNEKDKKFTASLSYEIDLITPSGKTISSLVSKMEDRTGNEKMSDTKLEAQLSLDSTYSAGKYKVVFRVRDVLSSQADSSSAEFKIGDEEI